MARQFRESIARAGTRHLTAAISLVLFGCFPADLAAQPATEPAVAVERFTLRSDDCIGVHADGEPWSQCGFQAFAMNTSGDRILTVSVAGSVDLWNERGEAVTSIRWPDQPGGAWGHPSAAVAIAGDTGFAIIHANQLLVIELVTGRELARHVLDTMSVRELLVAEDGRLLAAGYDKEWHLTAGVIDQASGTLHPIEGMQDLGRAKPGYWVTGDRAPFRLHRPGNAQPEVDIPRSCMPIDDRYCSWRDIPGRTLHILDVEALSWRAIDLGSVVDGYEIVTPLRAGEAWALLRCGKVDYERDAKRACSATDLSNGKVFHSFRADNPKVLGASGKGGMPELRIQTDGFSQVSRSYAVSFAGEVSDLGPANLVNLAAPLGGTIASTGNSATSLWRGADGSPLATLPFVGTACGNGWPSWMRACAASENGRVWLHAKSIREGGDRTEELSELYRTGVTVYDVPLVLAPE